MAKCALANWTATTNLFPMSTVLEIESAVKELPLGEAQKLAQWLLSYVDQQAAGTRDGTPSAECTLPDYAERRRRIADGRAMPNMVITGREQERW